MYKDMRPNLMKLLISLAQKENVTRIQFHLKNKMRDILLSNNYTVAFSSLILLTIIIEHDKNRLIMDFELINTLLLNLGTDDPKIFDGTLEILTEEGILSNDSYLQVVFSVKEIENITMILPQINEPKKAGILFNIIYHYMSDMKTASSFIKIADEKFYVCLYNWLQKGSKALQKNILDMLHR
jgi:hypothetical protein